VTTSIGSNGAFDPDAAVSFSVLRERIVEPGLCTHCGTCVGLSGGRLHFVRTPRGPLPQTLTADEPVLPEAAWRACGGKGFDYPQLNRAIYGQSPESWLAGSVVHSYLGYSADPAIRRAGASGGLITHILVELLERGMIDGAVVLRHGYPEPWQSAPIIAENRDQILASSQSVYVPTPVNTILAELSEFDGRIGYVGLPDQVASIRVLQQLGHPGAMKIRWIIGPYVGTAMYLSSIESFLRTHGGYNLQDLERLRYREGEWPGDLMIQTKDGRVLREGKFYYNYLIPFYITKACLLTMDFTNELTDISVGDAWSSELEARGKGFSVVLARTEQAEAFLDKMAAEGKIALETIGLRDALQMHAHMLDFKKRGAYIRARLRALVGLPSPGFGLRPINLRWTRYAVELVVSALFAVGGTRVARWLMERLPPRFFGPIFEHLRRWWKSISKSTKRRGIWEQGFEEVRLSIAETPPHD
jgi:coenzyme F420 hydrogenase subunit beta